MQFVQVAGLQVWTWTCPTQGRMTHVAGPVRAGASSLIAWSELVSMWLFAGLTLVHETPVSMALASH